jgi:hypothetical protein
MSEEEVSTTRTVLLLNMGRTVLSDNKEGYRFLEVSNTNFELGEIPASEDSRVWAFGKSITTHLGRAPGMVFEVDVSADSVKLGTVQYKGLWPNEEHRLRWEAEHKTLGDHLRLEARKKKDERFNNFEHRLEPIRDAYRNARGLQRSLILAHVVRFITG